MGIGIGTVTNILSKFVYSSKEIGDKYGTVLS